MQIINTVLKPDNLVVILLVLILIQVFSRTKVGRFLFSLNPFLFYGKIRNLQSDNEDLNNKYWEQQGEIRELKQTIDKLKRKNNVQNKI